MNVKIVKGSNSYGAATAEILVNGKKRVSAYPMYDCPEDATLERDLNFVWDIVPMMKEAYEAGVRGEQFLVEETKENEEGED